MTSLEALNIMQQAVLVEPTREPEVLVVPVLVVTLAVVQVVRELTPAQHQTQALVVVRMVI